MSCFFIVTFNLVVFVSSAVVYTGEHIKIGPSDIPTNSCTIHEMDDCEYMTLKQINNLFDY